MIQEAHGNLLEVDADALVNTVNTVGVMGKGIALQFKRAYPENFDAYEKACRAGRVQIGQIFTYPTGRLSRPYYILNFPTKGHWRSRSRLEDIESGLQDLRRVIEDLGIESIAVPPLGCGNGGLSWSSVRPLIHDSLGDLPGVTVLLYPPEGAPDAQDMINRTQWPAMTRDRAALVATFARYVELSAKASLSMDGKFSIIEAQKVAYFLQSCGWPLGLKFVPSYYGPYSQRLDQFISDVEGHYMTGYGDGSGGSKATLQLNPGAVEEAWNVIGSSDKFRETLRKFEGLVEGFEFPYGIELLSTVHYVVAKNTPGEISLDLVIKEINSWSTRKSSLFKPAQASAAFDHLIEQQAVMA